MVLMFIFLIILCVCLIIINSNNVKILWNEKFKTITDEEKNVYENVKMTYSSENFYFIKPEEVSQDDHNTFLKIVKLKYEILNSKYACTRLGVIIFLIFNVIPLFLIFIITFDAWDFC